MAELTGWELRLHAAKNNLPVPPVVAEQPEPGHYRKRRQDDGWDHVIIWEKDGVLKCVVNKEPVDALDVWTWCAKYPIDKDLSKHFYKTGEWLDVPAQGRKSNLPSDPYEAMLAELNDLEDQFNDFAKEYKDKEIDARAADKARNTEEMVNDIIKRADAMFKAEKQPHLDAGREVDTRYHFRRDVAAPLAKRLAGVWKKFARAEEDRQAKEKEAERKRVEAERQKIHDEQAKKMEDDPIAALTEDPPSMPELPQVERPKVSVGGGAGRKSSLKDKWSADVTDYEKAAIYFATNAELRALIDKLANRQATNSKLEAGDEKTGFAVKKERV